MSWTTCRPTKVQETRAAIKATGAQLFFLLPYSPDLNPIEMVFAKLKALLRHQPERTLEGRWHHARESEVVAELLGRDIEGRAAPIPLLLHLLDQRLWRYGALEAALAAASPAYLAASDHWAAVATDPQGVMKARTERRRRPKRNNFDQDVPGGSPRCFRVRSPA
nr:transposase [Arenibaculum pallidiluteum]